MFCKILLKFMLLKIGNEKAHNWEDNLDIYLPNMSSTNIPYTIDNSIKLL